MTAYSVLDLVPVREGGTLEQAFAAAASLARAAEQAGCKRYWVAEHHAMEGIAGGATAVVLAHIGHATSTIRIGSGGIMLPNHTPFQIAEQFGTLAALFPGRVDLGLGRAPGAGRRAGIAARAAQGLAPRSRDVSAGVVELRALLAGKPDLAIRATPDQGANVELWMLGSSLFGASLAAQLGLPYAFASHFAPDHLDPALALYRRDFQPSAALDRPRVMAAMNLFAAATAVEADYLASSQMQAFVRLRTGQPAKLPPPLGGYRDTLPPPARMMLDHIGQASAIGTPDRAVAQVRAFIDRTGAGELDFAGPTFDPALRERSLALAMAQLAEPPAGS